MAGLLESVRAALAAASRPAIVGALDGAIISVAGTGVPGGHEAAAARVADHLADRLSQPGSGIRVQLYDDLVLHRLLSPLIGGPELATFVEGELGSLIAYDDEHGAELVRTLDAFLQANGSKIATADRLFLRRRSVYYRLDRIGEILGCSLDSPDRRGRLLCAPVSFSTTESLRVAATRTVYPPDRRSQDHEVGDTGGA